ncbi:MAG: serine/threonine-protein phosphatase [Saprospiraceae bacterium]|nr:serine/threonine-protein phosphatase [Saprospiraceae bacterium]
MKEKSLAPYIHPQIKILEEELHNKQVQLNFLMRITQAINANMSQRDLFEMYAQFLHQDLGVNRLAMLFKEPLGWKCHKVIDYEPKEIEQLANILVRKYKDFSRLGELSPELLKPFELVIPVFHKDDPLAYILVGKINQTEDAYDRFKFMISITNVVAVAIENKRLFNRHVEQEAYKKELELAQRVQKMLIPSEFPELPAVELSTIYRPHSDIGGDYFDYFILEDGNLIICLADVSGKGIPAAILMANFQATMRSAVKIYHQLDDLVQHINTNLVGITKSERIVTFFILKFDPVKREIRYVNAGHNPPIYINGHSTELLKKGCPILGAIEHLDNIDVGTIEIGDSESLFVLYTDGLTDLRDIHGAYFDEEKLIQFSEKHKRVSAGDFNKQLLEAMEKFKGQRAYPDDIAVVTCKIKARSE